MRERKPALVGLMPARVRKRREARQVTGADLARRVGVSPAYVSQIEKGLRVPDVPVAVRLAHALDDDEALYVAWSRDHRARSRSKGPATPDDDAWAHRYRSDRFEDEESFGTAVSSGHDIPATPARIHSASLAEAPVANVAQFARPPAFETRAGGNRLVPAPVLDPGKDPGERDEVPRQLRVDEMLIDPRILPAPLLGRPFAFRADEEVSRRVNDRVSPGDLVVVSRDLEGGAPMPGKVYALRHGGRVFLGRLARLGDRFLVQPGPGETEMLDLGLTAGGPPKPAVVGEIAAVIKAG